MNAQERLDEQRRRNPASLELALGLAMAVTIEPGLIRRMRLHWLPSAGATAEADLWFGPLVEARTPTCISFAPDARELLLADLSGWRATPEGKARVEAARRLVLEAHAGLSPALRLEEELAWLAWLGDDNGMEQAVKSVLAAYGGGEGKRDGLEQWAARSWPRLPARFRDSTAGAALFALARKSSIPVRLARSSEASPANVVSLALIAGRLPMVALGVRRQGRRLELGEIPSGYSVSVPDTVPRMVQVMDSPDAQTGQWLSITPGATVEREVGLDPVRLSTVQGDLYELPPPTLTLHVLEHEGGLRLSLSVDGEDLWMHDVNSAAFENATYVMESYSKFATKLSSLYEFLPGVSDLFFPRELRATLLGASRIQLMSDDMASRWPWELMEDRWRPTRGTPQLMTGLLRQVRTQRPRPQSAYSTKASAFVVGNPELSDLSGFSDLPGANEEASKVASRLRSANYLVGEFIHEGAEAIISALFREEWRILHLVGQGAQGITNSKEHLGSGTEVATEPKKNVSGLVIGKNTFFTAAELQNMRRLPELVFINCRPSGQGQADGDSYGALATDLGTQFVAVGVKAVVTVGWPVEERTAAAFAESFYQELLTGVRFVDAIRATRLKIWDQFPDEAAWGAYQCYGDPDWQLVKPEAQAPALEDIEKQSGLSVTAMMDQMNLEEFGPGLFRIELGSELRLTLASVREITGEQPWLILIHTLSSNTRGSFGALWEPQAISRWQNLLHRYGERALAFQFASLGRSPLESALFLAQALPPNARLHLLTLSESGLIGELLARSQRVGNTAPFDEQDLALLAGHAEERFRLEHLSRVLQAKRFRIERFLRVACPAQGSRLFERLPVLGKDLSSALSPAWVMRQFADPRRMPGMAALLPDAPLIQLLNRPDVSTEAELSVVVGVSRSTTLISRLRELLTERFLGADTDLVVEAESAQAGTPRYGPAWIARFEGESVNHFNYFKNLDSLEAILGRLESSQPGLPWRRLTTGAGQSRAAGNKTPALKDWLALAPGPAPRRPGMKWDVFLSYRSINRQWVLQLYDILIPLGYSVFLDQYVLTAGQPLTTQLDEGLAKSASVVMVWSSTTEDSEWCKKEYAAFKTRQSNDPSFRFVLVKLDTVQLPLMTQTDLWLDFSDAREGPRGAGLLRLLYGLQGKPLPPEAIKLAAQVDDDVQKAWAAIRAARQNGDVEKLVELGKNESMAWNTSPQLFSEVAEALITLKKEEAALAVLDRTGQLFPRSRRPRQLKGLALARLKKWKEAQQILGELYEAGERDPETIGIYARTWMDRYEETGEIIALRKSRDLYAEAFNSAPTDSYTGINAASKSVFLGEPEEAAKYARLLEALVGTTAKPGDYWHTATAAEAQLIQRNFDAAGRLYAAAVAMNPSERGSHEATWNQARLLLDRLEPTPEQRQAVTCVFEPQS